MSGVQAVRMTFTKWGDRPHWEYDAVRLGHDEHGAWVGLPVGTYVARPGAGFHTGEPQVVLVSPSGYVATFYARGGSTPCDLYVDITTPPVLAADGVRAVDLDLDVLRGWTGRVWVDDEDEFALHRTTWGYPHDVVTHALTTTERVRHDIEHGRAPFDRDTPDRWFTALASWVPVREEQS